MSKCSPERGVDIVEMFGDERICMNSAADWGDSNPLATLDAAHEMRRRGHAEERIQKVFWDNPCAFLSQCPKFDPS